MSKGNYSYDLPRELIALEPSTNRLDSRLFVYNTQTGTVTHSRFSHIQEFLPRKYTLVLNETTVSPARMTVNKLSGGKVVALFLVNEKAEDDNVIRVMVDRKVAINERVFFDKKEIGFIHKHSEHGIFLMKLKIPRNELLELLRKNGSMPIPLYLRNTSLSNNELIERYQTVFAKEDKNSVRSVAAPTASLHFSPELLKSMQRNGATIAPVTLHVGLGTFARLTDEALQKGQLHNEWYSIPHSTIEQLQYRPIVAVGTTTVRTLESYAQSKKVSGSTNIFIRPPHEFTYVDALITNFHLPQSSLMMLVDAFLQYKKAPDHLVSLYHIAIENHYRFYSFGDAMLITSFSE